MAISRARLDYQNEYRKRRYDSEPEYAEKIREKQRRYVRNNPERAKDSIRKSRYGVPVGWYSEQYAIQEGKCLVCSRFSEILSIDHDHSTGEVRGLICNPCNAGIGLLQDDPSLLRKAADYLERNPTTNKEE